MNYQSKNRNDNNNDDWGLFGVLGTVASIGLGVVQGLADAASSILDADI